MLLKTKCSKCSQYSMAQLKSSTIPDCRAADQRVFHLFRYPVHSTDLAPKDLWIGPSKPLSSCLLTCHHCRLASISIPLNLSPSLESPILSRNSPCLDCTHLFISLLISSASSSSPCGLSEDESLIKLFTVVPNEVAM